MLFTPIPMSSPLDSRGSHSGEKSIFTPSFVSSGVLTIDDALCIPGSASDMHHPVLQGNFLALGAFLDAQKDDLHPRTQQELLPYTALESYLRDLEKDCRASGMHDVADTCLQYLAIIQSILHPASREVPVLRAPKKGHAGKVAAAIALASAALAGVMMVSRGGEESSEIPGDAPPSSLTVDIDESQVKIGDVLTFESFEDAVRQGYIVTKNGQMLPKDGYDWAHPEDPESYSVTRVR